MLSGVNDRSQDARRLGALLRGRRALVNVIPYNAVAGIPFRPPDSADAAHFADVLRRTGVNVQIRHRKGDRIDAACGQLRRAAGQSRGGESKSTDKSG